MLEFLLFIAFSAAAIILFITNRVKRSKNIDENKKRLIEEGKKELSLFINLKRLLPLLIVIVLIITNVVLIISKNDRPVKPDAPLAPISTDIGLNNFVGIFKSFSYAAVIYTILYLILMYKIKKSSEFSEDKREALLEYYGGRTIYLILTCIVLYILTFIISFVMGIDNVNVI